ncbi:MAG: nuclear transport factor 2 family protein [Bacteroidia bacterium]
MTTQNQSLSTQEVANRFFSLAEQGNFEQILNELFSDNAISTEPEHAELQSVQGLNKIREKAEIWNSIVEETHSSYTDEPVVVGDYFMCVMGMDVTLKGKGRTQMDEIAVYKVEDGKIVSEQFFY